MAQSPGDVNKVGVSQRVHGVPFWFLYTVNYRKTVINPTWLEEMFSRSNGQSSVVGTVLIVTTQPSTTLEDSTVTTPVWQVIVWDDPVNLMVYVVYVLRTLFGYPKEKATKLMLQVHNEGRSAVASGPREKVEMDCHRLHRYGLSATIERA